MTSKLTREKEQWLHGACEEAAAAGIKLTMNPNELLMFTSYVLAAMDSEPVVPIWGATKYPVSRPMPGTKLIVWDDTGKFVGYGSAVDTSESGVAIQMCDGRRFDSNHELRWQYALQPVPAMDSEQVAWRWRSGPDRRWHLARSGDLAGEVEPLYRHAQPALVVPDRSIFEKWWESQNGAPLDGLDSLRATDGYCDDGIDGQFEAWNACRAAMLQGAKNSESRCGIQTAPALDSSPKTAESRCGNSPVIPEGYVMVPKEPTAEMIAAAMNCDDVEFNSDETFCVNFDNIYAAMVEAAPQPQNAPHNIPEIIPGWIPVSERVPEKGQAVLVYRPKAHEGGDSDVRVAVYGRHNFEHGFGCYWEPSHWMPLPAAPQEVKGE